MIDKRKGFKCVHGFGTDEDKRPRGLSAQNQLKQKICHLGNTYGNLEKGQRYRVMSGTNTVHV
jgi:hypothetical protein